MGGVIRDTLTNKTPVIFSKEVYATACLAGDVLYLVLESFSVSRFGNFLVSSSLIVIIRIVVIKFKIELPSLRGKSYADREFVRKPLLITCRDVGLAGPWSRVHNRKSKRSRHCYGRSTSTRIQQFLCIPPV